MLSGFWLLCFSLFLVLFLRLKVFSTSGTFWKITFYPSWDMKNSFKFLVKRRRPEAKEVFFDEGLGSEVFIFFFFIAFLIKQLPHSHFKLLDSCCNGNFLPCLCCFVVAKGKGVNVISHDKPLSVIAWQAYLSSQDAVDVVHPGSDQRHCYLLLNEAWVELIVNAEPKGLMLYVFDGCLAYTFQS